MAEKEKRAKHAFGSSERVSESIANGTIDSFDILFLDGDTDNPKIGWVDKNGKPVILKDEKADLTELETELAKKADAEVVNAELDTINADVEELADNVNACENTHEKIKYEITDVPVGTLVDYREEEIRIMCPDDAVFVKQTVGAGGDANCYYCTFKTYVSNDAVVGYKEHLNGEVDSEILTDLKIDKYGRRYQPTWLALAKCDETTGTWNYYGKNSSKNHYIGYDYQIDWFNADGKIIASDSIRINLSNENCHSSVEPYYVGEMKKDIETMVEEKIAEADSAYEIIEF